MSEYPPNARLHTPGDPCDYCGNATSKNGDPCWDCWIPLDLPTAKAMFAEDGLSVGGNYE